MSKKTTKLLLIGAAAVGAYSFYKGKGVFNKIRFKSQHDAISEYLENEYPGATYSELAATDAGWSCVVDAESGRFVLYVTKDMEGKFSFWEKEII